LPDAERPEARPADPAGLDDGADVSVTLVEGDAAADVGDPTVAERDTVERERAGPGAGVGNPEEDVAAPGDDGVTPGRAAGGTGAMGAASADRTTAGRSSPTVTIRIGAGRSARPDPTRRETAAVVAPGATGPAT
jgi:hypothetical protein